MSTVDISWISSLSSTSLNESGRELCGDTEIEPCKIYGREKERSQLLDAFSHLVTTKQRQIVRIHGYSGSGKTALVEQLRDFICESDQGYFCSGKYFQNSSMQEPFSAIMAAFSDLCDLVSQSDDFTDATKLQIRQTLGSEAHLLTKVISNIAPFLQEGSDCPVPVPACTSNGSVAQFKIACKAFLHAMSGGKKPIVVFLDDLQWMDKGSRSLIELYLTDTELRNVMFILAYRDEDKEAVESFLATAAQGKMIDLSVENFDASEVASMVSEIMALPKSAVSDLSEMISQKTRGNPFHVLQFMEAIEREGLLVLDPVTRSWSFNVDDIQLEMMVADDLADMLLRKIQLLPPNVQETLMIASLLGYQFEEEILEVVLLECGSDDSSARSDVENTSRQVSLKNAIELGLIERRSDGFQFSHDKIQTAFKSMLSKANEQHFHRIIGEAFLHGDGEDDIFSAAVHLNEADNSMQDSDQMLRLARLNLDAAHYCIDRSAFDDAAALLRHGLSLLDDHEKWTTNFELVFEMKETLAKMELNLGNLNSCKDLIRETLQQAKSVEMKVKSLLIDVDCHMAGNEMVASIATSSSALRVLGVGMPQKISLGHLLMKFVKVRRMLRKKTDSDILNLPLLQDDCVAAASRILVCLTNLCFLQDEGATGAFCGLTAMELTLGHGLSLHSPPAVMVYGGVEIGFQNFDKGFRFGQLGMKLLNNLQCKDTECMTLCLWVSLLSHWKNPLGDSFEPMQRAVESGFAAGNPVDTSMAVAHEFALAYCAGTNLSFLEQSMRERYTHLCDLSRKAMLLWTQPPLQVVLNLQKEECDSWFEITVLTGEIMNEDDYMQEAIQVNHTILRVIAWSFKLELSYHFGFLVEAERIMKDITRHGKAFQNTFSVVYINFFGSLTHYQQYRDKKERRHLKRARKFLNKVQQLDRQGYPNAAPLLSLLQAEDASILQSKNLDQVLEAYNYAILSMSRLNYIHMEALVNERAGFFLASQCGAQDTAKQYFDRALYLYQNEWGAMAKVGWLQEKIHKPLAMSHVGVSVNDIPEVMVDILVKGTDKSA